MKGSGRVLLCCFFGGGKNSLDTKENNDKLFKRFFEKVERTNVKDENNAIFLEIISCDDLPIKRGAAGAGH